MPAVQRLLEELANAYGPTGFESPIRAIMQRELAPVSDDIRTDGIGSLIARREGGAGIPRIMICGHMDEVGLMVKHITAEGFIKFQALGGWLDQALINQRWTILTRNGPVHGVTGIKTVHVMTPESRNQIFKRDQIFIDVGAENREDAETRLSIRPGDPIAPDSRFLSLNESGLYLAKAWDDRAGLGVMIEVMKRLKLNSHPNTVYAVCTVQEEVGLRGAQTSSHLVQPDIGINLEAGVAGDFPGMTPDEAQESIGKGPAIFLHDGSMLPNIRLRDLCAEVAEDEGLLLQYTVLSGYGEDGAEMQRSGSGAPAINIAVPTRYLHSHNGIISRADFDQTVELVFNLIQRLDSNMVERLKSFD